MYEDYLQERIMKAISNWLDMEEGKSITLFGANPDFEGPNHVMEYTTNFGITTHRVTGRDRMDCIKKIYEETGHDIDA